MDDQSFYGRDINIGISYNVVFPVIVAQVILDIGQRVFHFLSDIGRYTIILTGRCAGCSGDLGGRLGNKKLLCYGVRNYRRGDRIEVDGRAYYTAKLPVHIPDSLTLTQFLP